jgi:uncharacterized protein
MSGRLIGRLVVLCVTVFSLTCWCQPGEAAVGEKSFLWKVRSKTCTAYVLGSMHLAKPDIYPLPEKIEESFDKSRILALEADPAKGDDPEVRRMMLSAAFYEGNETLRNHISKRTYDLAMQEMQKTGLPLETFRKAKPWFLAMSMEVLQVQRLGYKAENGIENHFAEQARGRKRIVELESFEYQIRMMDSFTDREQDLFLLYTLKELRSCLEDLDVMMRAWHAGDTGTMESLLMKSVNGYPEVRPVFEKLFYQRNREMAAKIEKFLQDKDTVFIIVGAGHLVGREGIIELLKAKGFVVEQM